ncbi:MAG: hypothetical protein HYY42_02695 [Chloroflexi bacterium]|nr:hypothetical protein [Chloroflexota bacterium]MBI2983084.1 hypothetical protein [Chloroflexota bacterium]
MERTVRFRPSFVADFDRQRDFLIERGETIRLERLFLGIEAARRRVSRFPFAHPVEAESERHLLRRLKLTDLPFVILYAHARGDRPRRIWFVRLFHYRQGRATVDPDLWAW